MSIAIFKPIRQGIRYPAPTVTQWRRILRKCKHINTGHITPCWIWCGRIDSEGYGEAKYNGEKRFVHRIAYARLHGETPAKRVIDHTCNQRACCNPTHLNAMKTDEHNSKSGNTEDAPIQVNRQNLFDFVGNDDTIPF